VNVGHAGDDLLEKYQKGKFDGEDGGPAEGQKSVNHCEWGVEQILDLIRAGFGDQGWIDLQRIDQEIEVAFLVDKPNCRAETHGPQ
jgi:hypothetical protein